MPRGDIASLVAEAVAHADVRCGRPPAHPDAAAAAIETRLWAQRVGLHPAAEGGSVDRTFPTAPVADALHDAPLGALRIASLFAAWLGVLTERAEASGWEPAYTASLVGVLRDGYTTGADALHFALTDLYERITVLDGAALLPELADALDRHAGACRREQEWRAADTVPPLAEFLDNLADRTPLPLYATLHRLDPRLGGPSGPPAPGVAPLHELAALLSGVDADLAGYRQAVETGRLTLVAVLMREYGYSVPAAFQSGMVLFGAWKTQLDHGIREIEHLTGVPASTVRQAHAACDWACALHRRTAALARGDAAAMSAAAAVG
ncbi:hypothetical protein GCM10023205_34270 [Yinghuangia aomiensis]|uniref:Uncharacterized protein n=1 Tax=Yinghuangia aomiensis TaxID=676205 RepID=A0ABP9HBW8_9ACTN